MFRIEDNGVVVEVDEDTLNYLLAHSYVYPGEGGNYHPQPPKTMDDVRTVAAR